VTVAALLGVVAWGSQRPDFSASARERAYRSNNIGVALLEQYQYREAVAAFRDALEIDPTLAVAHLNLSLALFYDQDLNGAAEQAAVAERLLPDAPQPPYVLGLIARARNRTEDATRWFQRALEIDPRDVGASVNLGQVYLASRREADAVAVLRPVVAEEPYHVTAAYVLGLALARSGDADEGQRLLERSQALRTAPYAVTFGTSYLEQGRYAEAIASTGAEPELLDPGVPAVRFDPVSVGAVAAVTAAARSPFGRRFASSELSDEGARALAASLGGGVTPIDADGDDDLDLFVASTEGQRLFRNDGAGLWVDATEVSGLDAVISGAVPLGSVAADYDNDGAPDLFVLRYGGSSLYRNDGGGRFTDVTRAAALPAFPFLPGAAAFADIDHDGDVDLAIVGLANIEATLARMTRTNSQGAIFPQEFEPAPMQMLRNNRDGTFTDITSDARLDAPSHAVALVPTDFDNRRDMDLLVVNYDGPPRLYKNLRDGTFVDVAPDVGFAEVATNDAGIRAVSAGDVNLDGFPDFFFGGANGGVLALSDARGRLMIEPAPDGTGQVLASRFVDYDNDGMLDLLTWAAVGPRMFRNLGGRWEDVTAVAVGTSAASGNRFPVSGHALAMADLDGDGRTDLATTTGGRLFVWRNAGDNDNESLPLSIDGRVSNRMGIGAKLQLRAGSLRTRIEVSAATPAVATADILFGLGPRAGADVVRVLWPSGILQAEAARAPTSGGQPSGAPAFLASPLAIRELDRKPSSCPFLYTWNGERFEFVTDFMGGGEMGAWAGPGVYNTPDPIEYVRIRGDQLRPRDGRLDVRVTSELEEVLFVDRLHLLAIAHPAGVDVFPNEGLTDPPKPFRLHGVRDTRVPVVVSDEHGHDVTDLVAEIDRRYPDDFSLSSIRGYAAEHTLTLDLGVGQASDVLLLTGWTDYAFSSDNVAAHQAGLVGSPPVLQMRGGDGAWRTADLAVGIPVGRPQTIALDLAGHLRPGEDEIRLVTSMRVYWDQILVGAAVSTDEFAPARLDPTTATVRSRGFSTEVRPEGRGPLSYDYERVSRVSPWKVPAGQYTREGDVRELLRDADDMFVIAKPGDEIALSFDAAGLEPLRDGWTRTFLLLADGYSKEMDINSASPDGVEPLPFRRMTRYPYATPEQYPDSHEHRRYRETYNTRGSVRTLPPLELSR
jgi:Tfp pilus assembly protein PilF